MAWTDSLTQIQIDATKGSGGAGTPGEKGPKGDPGPAGPSGSIGPVGPSGSGISDETNIESFPRIVPEVNDYGRFQRAVNDANATGKRAIRLKSNTTYTVNKTIDSFNDLTFIGDNSRLVGEPAIKFMDAMDRNMFINIWFDNYSIVIQSNKDQVNFDNCKFTRITSAGVYYYGGTKSHVSNCHFSEVKSSVIVDNEASNITIQDCYMTNPLPFNGQATESSDAAHVHCMSGSNIFVLNNKVFNSGGQGIIFGNNSTSGKGVTYSQAIGNHCEGNGQEGITCFGFLELGKWVTYGNTVMGNTCVNNRFHQIEIWQSPDNTVIGNTVNEYNTNGNMGAITLYQAHRAICTGNRIFNAAKNGIAVVVGTEKATITNNTIIGTNRLGALVDVATEGHGILLDSNGGASPTGIIIKDNVIESNNTTQTTTNGKWGVYSTDTDMNGNTIMDNRTYGYKGETHYYAKKTTKHMNDVKPTTTVGYDSYVENLVPAIVGTAGAKYIIKGWKLVDTTWVEDRALTGT